MGETAEWLEAQLSRNLIHRVLIHPLVKKIPNPDDRYITAYPCGDIGMVLYTQAMFDLFQGNRAAALRKLRLSYHILQTGDLDILLREIGVVLGGFQTYLLNACESLEDIHEVWSAFESLRQGPGSRYSFETRLYGQDFLFTILLPYNHTLKEYPKAARAERDLFRSATGALAFQAQNGRFPREDDLLPLLPNGRLPADPFLTTRTLRMIEDTEGLLLYSVGPDQVDDGGLSSSTLACQRRETGRGSSGDIVLRVPKERKMLFTDVPIQADDALDLLRQFPQGLPRDPYGVVIHDPFYQTDRGIPVPLHIMDATTTMPVAVASLGPRSEIVSGGDFYSRFLLPIFLEDAGLQEGARRTFVFQHLHVYPEDKRIDFYKTFEMEGLSHAENKVMRDMKDHLVYSPGDKHKFFPEGHRVLLPPYDPTNGTRSEGDLFIFLPPRTKAPLPSPSSEGLR
jgi:hypothetical protein